MANNTSGRTSVLAMAGVIAVVLALGIFALWDKVAENIEANRMAKGEIYVSDIANNMGMEVEDLLEFYGLTAEDGLTGENSLAEFTDKLTLGAYAEFMYGTELTDEALAEFKTASELGDDVTVDSKDPAVKTAYADYQAQLQAEAEAAQAEAAEAEAAEAEPAVEESADTNEAVEAEEAPVEEASAEEEAPAETEAAAE